MLIKIAGIILAFLLVGCNYSSPKGDEVLIIVNFNYGESVISSVRLDLRKIAPSMSPIVSFREDKEKIIYINNLNQDELNKLIEEFNNLNAHGKLVPTDDQRVYYYNLNDDLK